MGFSSQMQMDPKEKNFAFAKGMRIAEFESRAPSLAKPNTCLTTGRHRERQAGAATLPYRSGRRGLRNGDNDVTYT
jgi:hypothetical protein